MTASLWIAGPLPGLNEIIEAAKGAGGAGTRYVRLKRAWTETVWALALRAKLPRFKRARFTFEWRESDRSRNPDNVAAAHKFILDGLVLAKVLKNDGWGEVAGWSDTFEVSSEPGVLVTLTEVA